MGTIRARIWPPALALAAAVLCVAPALGQPAELPEGPAKPIIQTRCVACHELTRITGAGNDAAGWRNTVAMMKNLGVPLSPAESDTVLAYLVRYYPPRPMPKTPILAGPVKVSFTEWDVPTPGSRPHDPLAAADGSLWYSGQFANVLGRLDPKTGQFREYKAGPAGSGPHGLIEDRAGNVWYTANFKGYIGKLDPRTGQIVQYPMPDPAVRDPHTLLFDNQGIIWFTAQSANRVGRLDPKTGAIRLATAPTPHANPYGLVISSKGDPFFDEFGANKIGRIDPQTLAIREYLLPEGARPRRIAITGDDVIWYSDYARGYLGRLDPVTGKVTEWPSPGGPRSQPYAITALKGVIWYVESGTSPNALVRFDPATQRFQTFAIPSGGGVVRNMMPTADGQALALACSGVNKVALARIG